MSNSPLVVYTKLSPNCNKPRNKKIDAIVVHHMAGNASIETCGNIFAKSSRRASSNYGIGSDGRIAMYCEEANRSWCSSSGAIDHRAVTIEVANDGGAPNWHVSDKAFNSLVNLCADICKRNGIKKLVYTGDKTGNLHMHKWYAATGCPGPYLSSKFPELADKVNAILGSKEEPKKKPASSKKTNEEIAAEVWKGLWGSGEERKKKLTAAGYDYNAIQALVNKNVGKNSSSNSKTTTNNEVYVVKPGDTLYTIGLKYGKSYLDLAKYNNISNPRFIKVGDKIKIPK